MIVRQTLPALAGLLALLVLAEWIIPDGGVARLTRPRSSLAVGHRVAAPIVALGDEALAERILARPLFLAGRRVPPPIAVAAPAPVVREVPLPRLTGILMAGGTRVAVFQVAGAPKPVTAGVGDAVSAWTVTAIKANEVTLAGADGEKTLSPSGDPNTTPEAAESDPESGAADPAAGPDQ